MSQLKTPILILGYERSGTTLLRRLVSMHPNLEHDIFHEKPHRLMNAQSRDEAVKKLTVDSMQSKKKTGGVSCVLSGQKVPYESFGFVSKFVTKFRKFFPTSSILHIVRDPVYAINSQSTTFNRNPDKCISMYFNSVPKVKKWLENIDGVREVGYEDLTSQPAKTLQGIYAWLGMPAEDVILNKILTTKDPWKHGQKHMVGLRYFDKVHKRNDQKLSITKEHVRRIEKLKRKNGL